MPLTRTDLIDEVLDLLGVTQVGQDPAAEDVEKVDQMIAPVFASLAARRIIYVQDHEAIDEEYFNPLAIIIANHVGPKFGQAYDPSTDLVQERLLRAMQPQPGTGATLKVDYF